jgi:hypothetical protein
VLVVIRRTNILFLGANIHINTIRYFVGLVHLIFNKTNKLYGSIKDW